MNKKLIYSAIASLLFTFTSCDDFLAVTPPSGFDQEYVFSSERAMKSLLSRIYALMTEDGLYVSMIPSSFDMITDVWRSSVRTCPVCSTG